jgi:hypothetical protein
MESRENNAPAEYRLRCTRENVLSVEKGQKKGGTADSRSFSPSSAIREARSTVSFLCDGLYPVVWPLDARAGTRAGQASWALLGREGGRGPGNADVPVPVPEKYLPPLSGHRRLPPVFLPTKRRPCRPSIFRLITVCAVALAIFRAPDISLRLECTRLSVTCSLQIGR